MLSAAEQKYKDSTAVFISSEQKQTLAVHLTQNTELHFQDYLRAAQLCKPNFRAEYKPVSNWQLCVVT